MIRRDIESEIVEMSRVYPIVTLTGPRQSGKTTVLKNLFPDKPYVSMEDPDVRTLALSDPRTFLERLPDGAILDEVQRTPEIFSYLQTIVDQTPDRKGIFFLTGSHQFSLTQAISQSLAGRTAMLTLLPFSLHELTSFNLSLKETIFQGMYPRIYNSHIDATKFYRDYVRNYLERDVRHLTSIHNLALFQKFLKLVAGRIGQIFNAHSIANDVGVSHTTISHWISILEASYIIFRLPPYFENFGKRIIKSPKFYFTDVGLVRYLLDIHLIEQLDRDPIYGHLFENFVVIECVKHQLNRGVEPLFYFYRDSQQNEVDLLFKKGKSLVAVEIKSAQTFNADFLKGLRKFEGIVKERYDKGVVIYAGDSIQTAEWTAFNAKDFAKVFE